MISYDPITGEAGAIIELQLSGKAFETIRTIVGMTDGFSDQEMGEVLCNLTHMGIFQILMPKLLEMWVKENPDKIIIGADGTVDAKDLPLAEIAEEMGFGKDGFALGLWDGREIETDVEKDEDQEVAIETAKAKREELLNLIRDSENDLANLEEGSVQYRSQLRLVTRLHKELESYEALLSD